MRDGPVVRAISDQMPSLDVRFIELYLMFDKTNILTYAPIRTIYGVRFIEHLGEIVVIRNTRELGGFLRQAREDAGLTQADLAERLGVRRQRVLYLERGAGQLQLAFVFAVLKALGVELSLARTTDAATPPRPQRRASSEAAPYSIDDIADGGVD